MHEKRAHFLPSLQAPADPERDDLNSLLDEELSRLPQPYRAALVLCYLQGKTNEEAARLLRWPVGTVAGRMARARQLLRGRLVRRGFQASCALVAALLVQARAQARPIPAPLSRATARAGVVFATGETAPGLSSQAVRWAEAALRPPRYAYLAAALIALVLALAGAAVWVNRPAAQASAGTAPACHHCASAPPAGS
jgi:hypothetical protein